MTIALPIQDDPRWAQVQARDPAADGRFWFSVRTTGVYCRPSCSSRQANPGNVQFHATPAAARAAGFRPCRRCNPDGLSRTEIDDVIVEKMCRMIEAAERPPRLNELAASVELGRSRCAALFRARTGVTPAAYAAAARLARATQALAAGETVAAAAYEAGFGSGAQLHAQAPRRLGMTPGRVRRGGAGEVLQVATGTSSLGLVLVAASAEGVAAILLGDDPDVLRQDLAKRFSHAALVDGDDAFKTILAAAVAAVDRPELGAGLPLDIRGTAFQERVWRALRDIPAGGTVTYAELAARLGMPTGARAVAGACAANAHAVLIPCHRVVGAGGTLTGYRWGVSRKRALLAREAAGADGTQTR